MNGALFSVNVVLELGLLGNLLGLVIGQLKMSTNVAHGVLVSAEYNSFLDNENLEQIKNELKIETE